MGESVVGYEGSFYRVALSPGELVRLLGSTPVTSFVELPVVWAAGGGHPQESFVRAGAVSSVREP